TGASRLDVLEGLSVHARPPLIGLRQMVRAQQDIFSIHLVIELIETVSRLVLRLSIQLDLKVPNFIRHFQTCVNHRSFPPSQTHQKQGPFPPPELPGFIGTSDPFRRPDGPPPFLTAFAGRDSRDHPEPPPLTLD